MLLHDPLRLPDFCWAELILLFLVSVGQNPTVTVAEAEHPNLMFLELEQFSIYVFELFFVRNIAMLSHPPKKRHEFSLIALVQALDEISSGG